MGTAQIRALRLKKLLQALCCAMPLPAVFCACTVTPPARTPAIQSANVTDSLQLARYQATILREYIEDYDSLSPEALDSVLWQSRVGVVEKKVHYAPDGAFKIFVLEVEGCGAYCNSDWVAYVHFNLKSRETIKPLPVSAVDTIHKLPDGRYLILDRSHGRPASVMAVSCRAATLVSFVADSVVLHPIGYPHRVNGYTMGTNFSFCQENGVELEAEAEPYLRYNATTQKLEYLFGNNFAYSQGLDIDTIRQGSFVYRAGEFVPEKEQVQVNNREQK